MSFTEEAELYASLGGTPYSGQTWDMGSVLVIAYAGKGPIKEEIRPTVTIPDTAGILHTFQVALPKFVPRYHGARVYHVTAISPSDTVGAQTEVVEDVTAIASQSLDDRLALVYLKSGGRALLKFLAAEKAKSEISEDSDSKARNFLASLAIDLVVGATEQADTRTWRTLPAEFQLARLNLPPGTYTLNIASSDNLYALSDVDVSVQPGKTSFVVVDDVR